MIDQPAEGLEHLSPNRESDAEETLRDMLVVQFGDRVVKGFADSRALSDEASAPHGGATSVRVKTSNGVEQLPLDGVKALFFVRSFAGRGHDAIRFHDHVPTLDCLWVRVTFHDNEVVEGLVCNNDNFVLQTGFFMSPTDPDDNNWLIYIFKKQLRGFEVLGLRPSPNDLPLMTYAQSRKEQVAALP